MPVKRGRDKKGYFYRWGSSGKKYYFKKGDRSARTRAKNKAERQGRAIRASGYRG